jgi:hypothetical protein
MSLWHCPIVCVYRNAFGQCCRSNWFWRKTQLVILLLY